MLPVPRTPAPKSAKRPATTPPRCEDDVRGARAASTPEVVTSGAFRSTTRLRAPAAPSTRAPRPARSVRCSQLTRTLRLARSAARSPRTSARASPSRSPAGGHLSSSPHARCRRPVVPRAKASRRARQARRRRGGTCEAHARVPIIRQAHARSSPATRRRSGRAVYDAGAVTASRQRGRRSVGAARHQTASRRRSRRPESEPARRLRQHHRGGGATLLSASASTKHGETCERQCQAVPGDVQARRGGTSHNHLGYFAKAEEAASARASARWRGCKGAGLVDNGGGSGRVAQASQQRTGRQGAAAAPTAAPAVAARTGRVLQAAEGLRGVRADNVTSVGDASHGGVGNRSRARR